jgi:hypothetical protein
VNFRRAERAQWVGLTVLGLVAGVALALPLGVPIFAILGAMAGTPVVLGIVGLGLGAAQYPVLRRHFAKSWIWIGASALGMAIGLTAGVTLVEQIGRAVVGGQVNFRMLGVVGRALSFGAIGIVGGGSLGIAQWLVLRRHAEECKVWMLVNAWSLGAGLAFGSLLADALMLRTGSLASAGILLVTGGLMAGACTSRTLTRVFIERS